MARWGPDDGVVRYLVQELGISEEEVRTLYEAAREELGRSEEQVREGKRGSRRAGRG